MVLRRSSHFAKACEVQTCCREVGGLQHSHRRLPAHSIRGSHQENAPRPAEYLPIGWVLLGSFLVNAAAGSFGPRREPIHPSYCFHHRSRNHHHYLRSRHHYLRNHHHCLRSRHHCLRSRHHCLRCRLTRMYLSRSWSYCHCWLTLYRHHRRQVVRYRYSPDRCNVNEIPFRVEFACFTNYAVLKFDCVIHFIIRHIARRIACWG